MPASPTNRLTPHKDRQRPVMAVLSSCVLANRTSYLVLPVIEMAKSQSNGVILIRNLKHASSPKIEASFLNVKIIFANGLFVLTSVSPLQIQEPPFPGGRDNRAVRTQCQWVSQPTTGTAFMGTEVHALLTQVQSGLAECITHHHPPSCEEVHRAWVFHWHFRAGRMFPLHSFAARLTDK